MVLLSGYLSVLILLISFSSSDELLDTAGHNNSTIPSDSSNTTYPISRCGFNLLRANYTSTSLNLSPKSHTGSRFLQETRENDWSSLRIHIEYTDLNIPNTQIDYIKRIVQGSVKWYENTLKVKRLTGKLKLEGLENCVEVKVPSKDKTEGEDADIILYFSAGRKYPSILGYASNCATDAETGQPIAGMLYMDTNSFSQLSDEDLYSTAIHEMAHLLGFDPELFPNFTKPDGTKYTNDEMFLNSNGPGKVKIKTPSVLSKARSSFSCDSLDGVELESQGGAGTVGSHWEKRIMNDDFMVADSDVNDVIYSDISMALFEDSGWYKVDYSYTSPLLWGYHEGCDFITKPCITNQQANFPEYCTDLKKISHCDYKRLHKGVCNISKYFYPLPSEYQYFNDSTVGGSDMFLDYCPIVKPSYRGSCRDSEKIGTFLNPNYGEATCEDCRCVEGTYTNGNVVTEHAGCHRVECLSGSVNIHIGDETVECEFDSEEDVEVPNYKGVVHCKDSKKICDKKPCPDNCSGVGKCVDGECECPDGSGGVDCGE